MNEDTITLESLTPDQKVEVLMFYFNEFMEFEHQRPTAVVDSKHFGVVFNGQMPTVCLSVSDIHFMNKEVMVGSPLFREKIFIDASAAPDVNGYFIAVTFITPEDCEERRKLHAEQGWTETFKKSA